MKAKILIMAGCAAGLLSLEAQVFTIDDFEAAPFSQTGSSTTFTSYAGPEENIIGGTRRVRLLHQDAALPSVNATVADGTLTFNETDPSMLTLRYGSYASPTQDDALNLDLTSGYAFTIEVTSLTAPFDGYIDLYSYNALDDGHYYDSISFNVQETGTHTFNLFPITQNNWVDMSSVDGFEIQFGTGFGTDTGTYEFGAASLTPIPEPGTYAAIFAVGLLGFAGWRKYSLRNPSKVSGA